MVKEWQAEELQKISGAYWAGCVLQTGVELDIFTVLGNGPKDLPSLARELDCDQEALSMLVTALRAQELLDMSGDKVRAPEGVLRLLSRESPEYTGFIISHHAQIMKNWLRLPETVRKGRMVTRSETIFTEDEKTREDFLMGMFNVASLQAPSVASGLDFSGRARLMDIGGGPGAYAVYFCRQNPGLKADIFDLPGSGPTARKCIARFGLEGRITFCPCNFKTDPLPGNYDVAWISQVIHGENEKDAAALIAAAAACLNPGGLLCIQEFTLHDDRSGPAHAALFALNMLVQTPGGKAYTGREIRDMLKAAGAVAVRDAGLKLPMDCRVFIGEMSNNTKK
ncbi:MAG: methyltransferase domain-containing protein [Desulfovibrio sp.]|jgi:SAM-dependent methyltransferase|nr:methyltransferase domain-containing protein [Desulfovibrio sp.]